jgi:hypothetical protein
MNRLDEAFARYCQIEEDDGPYEEIPIRVLKYSYDAKNGTYFITIGGNVTIVIKPELTLDSSRIGQIVLRIPVTK